MGYIPSCRPAMGRKKRDWMKIQHEQEDGNSMRGRLRVPNWAAKAS
jgi:hypothetical protein